MNRLGGAASLYLRQHADNPVDWWPWGDAAFDEARRRDVPVFLSIGYAACHWCHVMAHECFEDPGIAALLNEAAVAVKVDREEHPDVDALYMSAVQAMTGQGGWPMSVFLLDDGRPFFAGTYFGPDDRFGRPGFPRVVAAVTRAWRDERDGLVAQADQLTAAVRRDASIIDTLVAQASEVGAADRLNALVDQLAAQFDAANGGFSVAPKFPHASWIEACAALGYVRQRADATAMATTTLDAMARGGIFDHVAGGFARYSVDAQWDVPHFEKMLSDQALLARCYLRASTWCDEPDYAWIARRTIGFVLDEMRVEGGFASAIDADAGGHEGAHIVLTRGELVDRLSDAGLAAHCDATAMRYAIGDDGPVDGKSVPRLAATADVVGSDDDARVRRALLDARRLGPQPAIDDKVLLEWNAMFASVLAEASWRLGDPSLGDEARRLVARLTATHHVDGTWRRHSGAGSPLATSADLAWLIDASVSLFELDADPAHLALGVEVAAALMAGHWDGLRPSAASPDQGDGLFQSHRDASALLVRAKDVLDAATPSGHSAAAVALARLGLAASDDDLLAVAHRLVELAGGVLDAQPNAAATLVEAACLLEHGIEVAVPGASGSMLGAVRAAAPPFCVIVHGRSDVALLAGRADAVCYVCRLGACQAPVDDLGSVSGALATAARW